MGQHQGQVPVEFPVVLVLLFISNSHLRESGAGGNEKGVRLSGIGVFAERFGGGIGGGT